MATKNAIDNNTGSLTVDPGASGDSYIQYNINGTGEFRVGVDDSDSDKYKIAQGSALETNTSFVMTASGERTIPLQPVFNVGKDSTVLSNVTGDGTVYTILWPDEVYDIGSNYNTGTGTFTAPVDGKYRFSLNVWIKECNNSAFDSIYVQIVTSNRTYTGTVCNPFIRCTQYDSAGAGSFIISVLADMEASDTCVSKIMVSNHTKTIVVSSVLLTSMRGWFMGSLVT
jgi:hypothetical protein